MLSTESLEHLIALIAEHQYLIAIITPLTVGEINMHAFGILYGSGEISVYPFFVGVAAIIAFETIIYAGTQALKRTGIITDSIKEKRFFKKLDTLLMRYDRQFHHHMYFFLIAMKTLPMTKIIIFLFALRYDMPVRVFVLKDTVVTVLWTTFLFIPGWFVGRELLTQETGLGITQVIIYALFLIAVFVIFGRRLQTGFDALLRRIVRRLESRERK